MTMIRVRPETAKMIDALAEREGVNTRTKMVKKITDHYVQATIQPDQPSPKTPVTPLPSSDTSEAGACDACQGVASDHCVPDAVE